MFPKKPENITKKKINWGKLIGLTIVNAAIAGIGGTTLGETMGIISENPKNALKLAGIGALLGASNLFLNVTKEVINEKFFKDASAAKE